jgi:hypothetical protein
MNTIFRTCIDFILCTPLSKRMGRVAGTLFLLTTAPLCYADGVDISVTPNGIIATATVEATTTVLRVGGPEEYRDEVRVEGGYVEWYRPSNMPDGTYRYEVYVITGSEDDESAETQLHRENGRFEVVQGLVMLVTDPDESADARSNK